MTHTPLFIYCLNLYLTSSVEGQSIEDLGEKNRAAGAKWREMSEECKEKYKQLAVQLPLVTPDDTSYDKWHETQRILSNMQQNVSSVVCFIT